MEKNAEKNIIVRFYVASVAIFVILAAIGYFWADRWGMVPENLSVAASSPAAQARMNALAYVALPRMTISLGNGAETQMGVDISLEVARKDMVVLEGYMPQIMDRFNTFLPKIDVEEVAQPSGIFLLRKNMLWEVNNLGMPVSVHDLRLQNLVFR
jgi:flagellar basal body-associated protein FliL